MSVSAMLIAGTAWVVEPSPIKAIKHLVETAYRWANDSGGIPMYYTDLDRKQMQPSLVLYLSRRFASHQEFTPEAAVERYLSPAPALFIIGTGGDEFFDALKQRHQEIPPSRLQRFGWRDSTHRLRSRPFWLVRNFD
jgi:hypothetical protein